MSTADDKPHFSKDFVNSFSKFVDANLREIRFRKFCQPEDIPTEFIKTNVRVHGIVKQVSEQGVLLVDHTPVLTTKWLSSRKTVIPYLPVTFCGIDLEENRSEWLPRLQDNLMGRHVWMRLMRINDSKQVECIITRRKYVLFSQCENIFLVKEGLATFLFVPELVDNPYYSRLSDKLTEAQIYADKKGKGIWRRPSLMELIASKTTAAKTSVRDRMSFLNWFKRKSTSGQNKQNDQNQS